MNCKIISAAAFAALLLLVGCASDASDADTSATSSYIELALLSGSSDHSPDMGETAEQLASRLLASGELDRPCSTGAAAAPGMRLIWAKMES